MATTLPSAATLYGIGDVALAGDVYLTRSGHERTLERVGPLDPSGVQVLWSTRGTWSHPGDCRLMRRASKTPVAAPVDALATLRAENARLRELLTEARMWIQSAAETIESYEPDDIDEETANAREFLKTIAAALSGGEGEG